MTAWRYLGRVGAAMLAASVAMLVVSTATERRASVVDAFQPAAPRGDDVVVVALGPAFTSRAELDLVTAYTPLITNLAAAEASVVVIEPDVLQLAQTRLALLGEGNSTSLVDAALQTLGNAVTASVVGDLEEGGDGRPRVGRPIPRTPIEPPWVRWRLLTLETRMEPCRKRRHLGSRRRVATARRRRSGPCERSVSCARSWGPITAP